MRQAFDLFITRSGESASRASTIWACRACRRSWRRAVRHLVRQSVLEVYSRSERAVSIQNSLLEVCQPIMQRRLGSSACLQQRQGTSLPITAAVCRRRFASGGSRSMRAASTACTVAAFLQALKRLRQPIGTRRSDQHPRLPRVRTLSSRRRDPSVRAHQELLEWLQAGIVPRRACNNSSALPFRQRVEAQLRVIRLAAPAVRYSGR